jgi:predicted subunit of tRNA(5-methylaminomethyl-2-thiouridylate) methyltransferase
MACLAFVAEAESNWGMVEGYQHTRAQVDYIAERLKQIQDGLRPDSRYPSREYQLISHLESPIGDRETPRL